MPLVSSWGRASRQAISTLAEARSHLIGKRPFRSEDLVELTEQIQSMEARPPRQLDDRIPPTVEQVCLKALSKSPVDRYATALDFATALRLSLSAGERHTASQTTNELVETAASGADEGSNGRYWMIGVAAVIALCGILGPISIWRNREAGTSANQAVAVIPGAVAVKKFDILASRDRGPFQPLEELLPLRNGDHIRCSVELTSPGYVRLVWIDAHGEPAELYPRDPEFGFRGDGPVAAVKSPEALDRGWPLEGRGGMETALLLISRKPLKGVPLDSLKLPAAGDPSVTTMASYIATSSQRATRLSFRDEDRTLGAKSQQMDDAVLQLLETLRRQADIVQAVSIVHRGEPK